MTIDKYTNKNNASMGIIGAEANSDFCKMCLDFYDSQRFNIAAPPIISRFITTRLFEFGFTEEDKTQHLTNGLVVYKSDYFYPIHYTQDFKLEDVMNMQSKIHTAYTFGTSRGLTNCSCLQKGITKRDFVL